MLHVVKTPMEIAVSEATRLVGYNDGWHAAKKHGHMTFGELEEGQYFLWTKGGEPVPIGDGWGTNIKYHEASTIGENKHVNYCQDDNSGNGVKWRWLPAHAKVYGLNIVEEY